MCTPTKIIKDSDPKVFCRRYNVYFDGMGILSLVILKGTGFKNDSPASNTNYAPWRSSEEIPVFPTWCVYPNWDHEDSWLVGCVGVLRFLDTFYGILGAVS